MNARRWEILLLAAFAAVAARPALGQVLGQDLAPAAGPAGTGGIQSGAAVPDFSGIWAHLTWPDVEPPSTGPGPVTNRSRRSGASDIYQLVGDDSNPILQPQAAEVVKKHGEISLTAVPYPTPSNQCWPAGVPFIFSSSIGMQMFQQPDKIEMVYSNDHEVRHVRMNQPHPARLTPSWYGDSVGHYEGDTLVIDTVGVKIGPFAMVDMYGTPYSQALHVVERYRLLDNEAAKQAEERGQRELTRFGGDPGFRRNPGYKGMGLQLEFTVEDDGVFTKPWSAAVSYRRPSGEWPEMVCAENLGNFPGHHTAVPTADKPDF